ncbi:GMP synthetase [Mycoplasma sp. (ex Biomphalaria glabrata)]|uniref:glutamine-hydrolyzing GMP synthase n=1 Tax=Mycoplasma sp. (ex Biomphalaria glabrata) TaxID=1749074 RepID=UPI00073AB59B|nr:glutamine-hydrolyzing GMP synthase [Mycoplasma sp. (ex Biomphalaria glabrata)]ALV23328.1 GMP synthetase [Mycoplasma sp. (ex Biomphalaria glabrata)]
MNHQKKIIILDFGSQYTQLIAKNIRRNHVACLIVSCKITAEELLTNTPTGIILSGGPESVYDSNGLKIDKKIFDLNIPILGICYGMQLITDMFGGKVTGSDKSEFGANELKIKINNELFEDVPKISKVWMSHSDHVTKMPSNFEITGESHNSIASIKHKNKKIYGVQFHPEVTHTEFGSVMISNFIFKICEAEKNWMNNNFIENKINKIRETVKNNVVILALSGGVDSSVVALLLQRAIGKQLKCFFVNHGLLRDEECLEVINYLKTCEKINIDIIDAKQLFLSALSGKIDPEDKRKTIGAKFIEVFEKEAITLNGKYLAQGTIYSDVIESSGHGKTSKTIKSHHNVGGLPEKMHLKIIEPVNDLFKDEVRELGVALGLPKKYVNRHPFPGPGFTVRILGEVTEDALNKVKKADHIFIEELQKHDLYDKVSQAFAVFLPIKSVGVMGDYRTYDNVIAIRSINTVDFMTGTITNFPFDFLTKVSTRIVNEVKGINRVVYDITSKPPGTIEWE